MSEVVLRYLIKKPLSYGEMNGGSYIITHRYNHRSNLRFLYLEGRQNIHTLEFDSGEIRDNNCLDYTYTNDTCNALGLRGVLPSKTKNIVLTLGDSFTEGAGAPADSSIPALLRQYIAHQDPNTDLLNAGISGNDIFFDWEMVHKLENKYKLKELIFLINTTDINDVATRGGSERFRHDGSLEYKKGAWWEPVYAVSFVFRLLINNAFKLDYNLQTPAESKIAHEEAINKICALVKNKILPWCNKNETKVSIVLLPHKSELKNAEEYNLLHDSLLKTGSIRLVDCMPVIKEQPNAEDLYWEHDLHFKPVGYSYIARYIIQNIYEPYMNN